MPGRPPEELTTPRLVLRRFRRRDAAALDEAARASMDELGRWLPWAVGYDRSVASRFVRDSIESWTEGRAFDFAIRFPARPGWHVGNVSIWFTNRQGPTGEVGYWVRSDAASSGLATEAAAAMVGAGFTAMGLHRVVLRIAVGNRPSERIAEKLGFQLEGTLREELKVGTRWLDHTLWGLLEHEWRVEHKRYEAEGWV